MKIVKVFTKYDGDFSSIPHILAVPLVGEMPMMGELAPQTELREEDHIGMKFLRISSVECGIEGVKFVTYENV